jgi:hypothetical protein
MADPKGGHPIAVWGSLMDTIETPAPKPRYTESRVLLNWNKNDRLRVLKMLAWVVYKKEGLRNADALEARVKRLCPVVVQMVLGEAGVTLDVIKEQALAEQGAAITSAKLLQRADKTERYCEYNEQKDAVLQAYDALRGIEADSVTPQGVAPSLSRQEPDITSLQVEQVRASCERQRARVDAAIATVIKPTS